MVIFHSYVKLPEGNFFDALFFATLLVDKAVTFQKHTGMVDDSHQWDYHWD